MERADGSHAHAGPGSESLMCGGISSSTNQTPHFAPAFFYLPLFCHAIHQIFALPPTVNSDMVRERPLGTRIFNRPSTT